MLAFTHRIPDLKSSTRYQLSKLPRTIRCHCINFCNQIMPGSVQTYHTCRGEAFKASLTLSVCLLLHAFLPHQSMGYRISVCRHWPSCCLGSCWCPQLQCSGKVIARIDACAFRRYIANTEALIKRVCFMQRGTISESIRSLRPEGD